MWRTLPTSSCARARGGYPLGIECFGNCFRRRVLFGEQPKDALNYRNFPLVALRERDALVLDALALAGFERLQRAVLLVKEQPVQTVGRRPAGPKSLLGNLHASAPDFVAKFLAVRGRPVAVDVQTQKMDQIVVLLEADGSVDDFLAVLSAKPAEIGGLVNVLKSPPSAYVEHEIRIRNRPRRLRHTSGSSR